MSRPLTTDDLVLITRTIRNGVITAVCDGVGVEKLSDIRLLAESSGSGSANMLSAEVEAKLRDPGFVSALVEAIASNEELCGRLGFALEQCRKKKYGEAAERRRENLTAAVVNFYNDRDESDQVEPDAVATLVEQLDNEGVVRGLRITQYADRIAKVIPERETAMAELISELCKARTNQAVIAANARLLVMEGLPLEKSAVRTRLEQEDDIASFLKTR